MVYSSKKGWGIWTVEPRGYFSPKKPFSLQLFVLSLWSTFSSCHRLSPTCPVSFWFRGGTLGLFADSTKHILLSGGNKSSTMLLFHISSSEKMAPAAPKPEMIGTCYIWFISETSPSITSWHRGCGHWHFLVTSDSSNTSAKSTGML